MPPTRPEMLAPRGAIRASQGAWWHPETPRPRPRMAAPQEAIDASRDTRTPRAGETIPGNAGIILGGGGGISGCHRPEMHGLGVSGHARPGKRLGILRDATASWDALRASWDACIFKITLGCFKLRAPRPHPGGILGR